MRRHDAEVERDRLQRNDLDHTYLVRERGGDEWEVVRVGMPSRPLDVRAERGTAADPPDDPRSSLIRQIPPYGPPGV